MAQRKKKNHTVITSKRIDGSPQYAVKPFDLRFLEEIPIKGGKYFVEDVLETAKEKAEYYRDIVQSKGRENFKKMARVCRKKAAGLRRKIAGFDEADTEPFLQRIQELEWMAEGFDDDCLDDPTPPDVEPAQYDDGPMVIPVEPIGGKRPLFLDDMKLKSLGTQSQNPSSVEVGGGMEELRRKFRFWNSINDWGAYEQLVYYYCGDKMPEGWWEAMFVRAQKDLEAIPLMESHIRRHMGYLFKLAEMGNVEATKDLVQLLNGFVERLNLIAKVNLETFSQVGEHLLSWPVIYSPHPKLDQSKGSIAREVNLGQATEFEFWPGAEWNPKDKGCRIAMELYRYINQIREFPKSNQHSPYFSAATGLPPIKTTGGVRSWWELAEQIFSDQYPKPQIVPALAAMSNLKDRGKLGSKIREKIENRFASLFKLEYR